MWKFFTSNKKEGTAICRICLKKYRTSGNTSNLAEHLTRMHKEDYEAPSSSESSENEEHSDRRKTTKHSQSESEKKEKLVTKQKQGSIRSMLKRKHPYKPNNPKKIMFDKQVAKMVVVQYLPFSIVDGPEFIKLCNMMDSRYVPPSRKILSNTLIPQLYSEMKDKLLMILNSVQYVSLTSDCWSSKAVQSYLTVTCNFVYNGELKNVVLDTLQVDHSHTVENLSRSVEAILNNFNIPNDKVVCLTTDNATNALGVAKTLGFSQIGCYAHKLNLVVADCLFPTPKSKEKFPSIFRPLEPLYNAIENIKKIVTHFHCSTIATSTLKRELENNGDSSIVLVQDIKTRWNSTLDMLERFSKIAATVTVVMFKLKMEIPTVSFKELQIIDEVIACLRPFKEATTAISGSNYVTSSLIIPSTTGIIKKLEGIVVTTAEAKQFKNLLLERTKARLLDYEKIPICGFSTLLDPRFKNLAFYDETNIVPHILGIQDLIKKKKHSEEKDDDFTDEMKECELPDSGLFSFVKEHIKQRPTVRDNANLNMLSEYLNEPLLLSKSDFDFDPIKFWHAQTSSYAGLRDIATKYLIACGSSVSSEHIFSSTGCLIDDYRTRLTDSNVNKMTFIKNNFWLLD